MELLTRTAYYETGWSARGMKNFFVGAAARTQGERPFEAATLRNTWDIIGPSASSPVEATSSGCWAAFVLRAVRNSYSGSALTHLKILRDRRDGAPAVQPAMVSTR